MNFRKRILALFVDRIVFVFFLCGKIFNKKNPLKNSLKGKSLTKILVIRLDHIGDVLLTTPVYRALRKRYPNAEINTLVGSWGKAVALNSAVIDKVLIYDAPWFSKVRSFKEGKRVGFLSKWKNLYHSIKEIKNQKYDLIIDIRGDLRHLLFFGYFTDCQYLLGYGRTGGEYLLSVSIPFDASVHELEKSQRLMRLLGISHIDNKVCLEEDAVAKDSLYKILNEKGITKKKLVVLSPGARKQLKLWPIENYIKISDWLINSDENLAVVFVGAVSDQHLSCTIHKELGDIQRVIDLIGKTSIMELFSLLKMADLIITNDGPIMHMASAFSVPVIAMFGPTEVQRFKPLSNQAYVCSKAENFSCSPCDLSYCKVTSTKYISACMRNIDVSSVKAVVKTVLKKTNRS